MLTNNQINKLKTKLKSPNNAVDIKNPENQLVQANTVKTYSRVRSSAHFQLSPLPSNRSRSFLMPNTMRMMPTVRNRIGNVQLISPFRPFRLAGKNNPRLTRTVPTVIKSSSFDKDDCYYQAAIAIVTQASKTHKASENTHNTTATIFDALFVFIVNEWFQMGPKTYPPNRQFRKDTTRHDFAL